MSGQSNPSTQSIQTSEELQQSQFNPLHANKQAIEELSDEELEMVAGGGSIAVTDHVLGAYGKTLGKESGETEQATQVAEKSGKAKHLLISGVASAAGGLFGPGILSSL